MKNKKISVGSEPTKRPQAWIAVCNNRQKIYQDSNVYLSDGQEFQIEFYNPTSTSYVAKIHINGSLISASGIVIKPGQRYFLDRFIDTDRKLTFSTYSVEDTKQNQEAISKNGLVKVEFYPEHVPPQYNKYWLNGSTITTNCAPTFTDYGSFRNHGTHTAPYVTFSAGSGSNTLEGYAGTYTSSSYFSNSLISNQVSIETGRIEGGKKSDQSFDDDCGVYSSWVSFTDTYKILPNSNKSLEISEIRSYCTECGTRVKKANWKFCPTCGEVIK